MAQFNLTLRPKVAQLLNKYRFKSTMINDMILYCLNYKSKDYQNYLIDDKSLGKSSLKGFPAEEIGNTMDSGTEKPTPSPVKGNDALVDASKWMFDSQGRPIGRRY